MTFNLSIFAPYLMLTNHQVWCTISEANQLYKANQISKANRISKANQRGSVFADTSGAIRREGETTLRHRAAARPPCLLLDLQKHH